MTINRSSWNVLGTSKYFLYTFCFKYNWRVDEVISALYMKNSISVTILKINFARFGRSSQHSLTCEGRPEFHIPRGYYHHDVFENAKGTDCKWCHPIAALVFLLHACYTLVTRLSNAWIDKLLLLLWCPSASLFPWSCQLCLPSYYFMHRSIKCTFSTSTPFYAWKYRGTKLSLVFKAPVVRIIERQSTCRRLARACQTHQANMAQPGAS